jgi:hypothetical protein
MVGAEMFTMWATTSVIEVRETMDTLKRFVTVCTTALVVTAGTASAQVRSTDAEQIRSRQQIATFETVLQQAVSIGAQNVIAQVRSVVNAPPRLGTPRASGFRLDGVGVVFNVSVPAFEMPILWEVLVREAQFRNAAMNLQRLRVEISGMPAGPERVRREQMIAQLETELAIGNLRPAEPPRGAVTAQSLVPVGIAGVNGDSIDQKVAEDPESAYTREVKAALIGAMLTNSQGLGVGPEERLIVVARDGVPANPQFPADSIDSSIWIMSVKGSVLAAFRSGSLTEEEARKQVEVTEQ